ncbi:hypothetical protein K458DRAFT_394054 [Lentithecium fluviatile CBS 122367]|uniref:Uncharacterized protein n=1 Tax=Lentithecium fluviatile CBS 122367 TaxID=1168545 RepID=A0A6G1INA8_9PLEO|nr:hypothetical protein K458DRAFT_394054 [Lentithecium fluviatile CBS 122367]
MLVGKSSERRRAKAHVSPPAANCSKAADGAVDIDHLVLFRNVRHWRRKFLLLSLNDDNAQSNQFVSPLLRLPLELRLVIYRLALTGTIKIVPTQSVISDQVEILAIPEKNGLALLTVCRTMHAETADLTRPNATFEVSDAIEPFTYMAQM